jgi:hypothetical protein
MEGYKSPYILVGGSSVYCIFEAYLLTNGLRFFACAAQFFLSGLWWRDDSQSTMTRARIQKVWKNAIHTTERVCSNPPHTNTTLCLECWSVSIVYPRSRPSHFERIIGYRMPLSTPLGEHQPSTFSKSHRTKFDRISGYYGHITIQTWKDCA